MITSPNQQMAFNEAGKLGVFLLTYHEPPPEGTGANVAGKGCLCVDTAAGVLYINTGTLAVPVWAPVTVGAPPE